LLIPNKEAPKKMRLTDNGTLPERIKLDQAVNVSENNLKKKRQAYQQDVVDGDHPVNLRNLG